jgi:hypothetical protein
VNAGGFRRLDRRLKDPECGDSQPGRCQKGTGGRNPPAGHGCSDARYVYCQRGEQYSIRGIGQAKKYRQPARAEAPNGDHGECPREQDQQALIRSMRDRRTAACDRSLNCQRQVHD